ncbi:Transcription factor GLABRA 3 [Senna tora]|uniref:Transcription factor GLABRA 3 n=1 Tax=Senna tora TaxID=362788 RepID=A0A835CA66_9FABA|nr:Transcription factor GLABRA 3 [Senna tora]
MVVPEDMKKQLALAVRSIQWSYAIYWSASATQPGVLGWGEGYYNGDIKTRKTSQGVELNADQIGLQRSEQLRDLYESLATAESNPQTKRPSVSLSPEDLTDSEWYYLVCMSFIFNIGQGLPGRTLANGQPIWLYNAHCADSRVFIRSLLAKTVVCFPFLDGVLELGTTDLVSEDPSLIQRIRTSFLDILDTKVREKNGVAGEEVGGAAFDHNNGFDMKLTPELEYEVGNNVTSPNSSSNAFQANQSVDETTFMVQRINGGASQVQSWQVMEDELSNCVHNSMNTSDCISQTLTAPPEQNAEQNAPIQECKNTKMTLVDAQSGDDWHYQRVLSALLKSSDQLIMGAHFQNSHREKSGFVSWKKEGSKGCQWPRGGSQQKVLKKVLFEVPRMHIDWLLELQEENDYKEIGMNHVLSERRRRTKLNEKFLALRSIVPSITKDDKVSILDEAIEYLKKLETKFRGQASASTKKIKQALLKAAWNNINIAINKKKSNFPAASFRGFGCSAGAASQQVSVPAAIRTSADWRGTKARKKKHVRNGNGSKSCEGQGGGVVVDGANSSGSANLVDFQDVWCGPGIGFSADIAAPVDCVTARKNVSVRGKIDAEKITHKERRRTVNPESISFLNSDTDIFTNRSESLATARYYRHVPHPSSDGFSEMMLLQGNLLMGGRLNSRDHFREMRLDVDNMSYEQLLALSERIGYVNTGLKEDEIRRHTRKCKFPMLIKTSEQNVDKNCSICQEEYVADDDLGRLKCEHSFHFQCLKQWLALKNSCPVCKQEVVMRHSVAKSSKS